MRRLSPGTLIIGVLAILFGLIVAYGVKRFLQQPAPVVSVAEKPKQEPPLRVPLAVVDLPADRTLVLSDIVTIP